MRWEIANRDVELTDQEPVLDQLRRRKWSWLGHTPRIAKIQWWYFCFRRLHMWNETETKEPKTTPKCFVKVIGLFPAR